MCMLLTHVIPFLQLISKKNGVQAFKLGIQNSLQNLMELKN